MASLIYLDTHVVAWLYAGRADLFPDSVRRILEGGELLISPMVTLELEYLFEVGRTSEHGAVVVQSLERDLGLRTCDLPFAHVVEQSLTHDWTRDPFDRLIVAQAELRDGVLLTKDRQILEKYPQASWGD